MFKRIISFFLVFAMSFSVLQIVPFKGINNPVKVFAEDRDTDITDMDITETDNKLDESESRDPVEGVEEINDADAIDIDNELDEGEFNNPVEVQEVALEEVSDIEITNMYVAPNKLELYVGGPTDKLTAAVYIKGSSESEVVKDDSHLITWESNDESVVKVDSNGTLTPIGVGTTTVTARSGDNAMFANCEITVTELDDQSGILVNSSFVQGSLNEHSAFEGKDLSKITKLVIGTGTVNADDLTWIKGLTNLEELEVIGTAMPPSTGYNKWDNKVKKITLYNVTSLGGSAFQESENIEYIYCRDVTSIGIRVFAMKQFQQTSKLHTIRLPKLEKTSYRTWYYCSSLKTLELGPNAPEIKRDEGKEGLYFSYASTDITVVVPDKAAYDKYMDVKNCDEIDWSAFPFKALNGEELPLIEKAAPYIDTDYDYLREEYAEKNVPYNKADIPIGLNFYTFSKYMSAGQTTWVVPPVTGEWTKPTGDNITILEVIRWAKDVGFDAVDVTGYYLPGYSNTDMPTVEQQEIILQRAAEIKKYAEDVGIAISGTGIQNSFTDPSDTRRAKDIERIKFYLDVAEVMGAPCLRIFAGTPPADVGRQGWESIINNRLVPAIQECADYAKEKNYKVMIGVQTHGDILATGNQALYAYKTINRDNVGIINDTGYYHGFLDLNTDQYDWYTDIKNVLPVSTNFQLKKKPAGAGTSAGWLDLERLFKDIRSSSYKNSVPIEMLWGGKGLESDYPDGAPDSDTLGNLTLSRVYNETEWYLGLVKAAMEKTKDMAPVYKVTFESNGGSLVAAVDVESGDKVSKPANPTKANNTFIGWYEEDTLSNLFDFTNTRITADIKLYAKWRPNSSDSSNDPSDGGGATPTQPAPSGSGNSIPKPPVLGAITTENVTESQIREAASKAEAVGATVISDAILVKNVRSTQKVTLPSNINTSKVTTYVFLNSNGTLTPVPTYIDLATKQVSVLSSSDGIYFGVTLDKQFNDVKASDWFASDVLKSANKLIVHGFDNQFRPNEKVIVAEVATMFLRSLGIPVDESAKQQFLDVDSQRWYASVMATALKMNMLIGDKGIPEANITRISTAEISVAALKAVGIDTTISDSDIDKYLRDFKDISDLTLEQKHALAVCIKNNIFGGYGDNTMKPNTVLNRAEMTIVSSRLQAVAISSLK